MSNHVAIARCRDIWSASYLVAVLRRNGITSAEIRETDTVFVDQKDQVQAAQLAASHRRQERNV